jgi:hypothetical protein
MSGCYDYLSNVNSVHAKRLGQNDNVNSNEDEADFQDFTSDESSRRRKRAAFNRTDDYKLFCQRYAHLEKNKECTVVDREKLS